MNTKLTLSIDSQVVAKAKKYLQKDNQSLSGLVEEYFRVLIEFNKKDTAPRSVVKELTGVAKKKGKSPDELITNYLDEKYK